MSTLPVNSNVKRGESGCHAPPLGVATFNSLFAAASPADSNTLPTAFRTPPAGYPKGAVPRTPTAAGEGDLLVLKGHAFKVTALEFLAGDFR